MDDYRRKPPRFWKVTFDKVIEVKDENESAFPLDENSQRRVAFDDANSSVISTYESLWKEMDKKGLNDWIAMNSVRRGAHFFGGLHQTCKEDTLSLFFYAMTKPWNDDEQKPTLKLLDIGHGYGYYLVLAILLGFKVVAVDLNEGKNQ